MATDSVIYLGTVYDWLRVPLVSDGASPPCFAPVDESLIRTLLYAAEVRIDRFIEPTLKEILAGEAEPATDSFELHQLIRAVLIDVAVHYFNRLDPQLPDSYFEAIAPWRKWGFGA